jgi:hypothetical protein
MVGQAISFGPFRLFAEQRLLLEGDQPVRLGYRRLPTLGMAKTPRFLSHSTSASGVTRAISRCASRKLRSAYVRIKCTWKVPVR